MNLFGLQKCCKDKNIYMNKWLIKTMTVVLHLKNPSMID